ncbi:MAG: hypothetical protein H7326_04595 [Bdellovibrionaceae bacterium]|nr:hypothetical protein [Pseudobdellovibrionaceae bacterium]
MRQQIIGLLVSLTCTLSQAAEPKEIQEIFAQSTELRTAAAKAPTAARKKSELKKLKSSLSASANAYKKMNPEKGDAAEDKVTLFALTMEPVFKLKKTNAEECRKAEHQIDLEDKMGKPEDAVLTADALEALEWLKVLCPPK